MKLDNTDFSRKKSEAELKAERLKAIRNAEDVWAQKSGSSDDMALLYCSAGPRRRSQEVWPMQVVDRSRAIFDARYLNIGQLDDYIAVIEIGGKEIYLDPGQKMCPFGLLHWKHALATGARLSDKGPVEAATPAIPYSSSVEKRVALLDIDPTGAVKGTVQRAHERSPDPSLAADGARKRCGRSEEAIQRIDTARPFLTACKLNSITSSLWMITMPI